jgi:hypothetical protein
VLGLGNRKKRRKAFDINLVYKCKVILTYFSIEKSKTIEKRGLRPLRVKNSFWNLVATNRAKKKVQAAANEPRFAARICAFRTLFGCRVV